MLDAFASRYSPLVKGLLQEAGSGRMRPASQRAAISRLQHLLQQQTMYPGRAPGGTGPTGLLSTDAKGYSDLLNEQTEAADLQRLLNKKAPMQVVHGGF